MSRRSDHNRDERYTLALTQAANLVTQEGLGTLTVRKVAGAMGYSVGTLYNLFENLDDLVFHLNAQTLTALHDTLSQTKPSQTAGPTVRGLVTGYLAFVARHPRLWGAVLEHKAKQGDAPPDWYMTRVEAVLGLLEHALEPLCGPDPGRAPREAAVVIWSGLHGLGVLSEAGKLASLTDRSVETLAELLTNTFLNGLKGERT